MIEVEVVGVRDSGGDAVASRAATATPPELPSMQEMRRLCTLAAHSAGVDEGHVAIEFIDERRMTELNARHRALEQPTDVLSFPIDGVQDAPGARELGDVMICLAHTADVREAIVHGVLHLVGMDHETDEGQMLDLQRQLLAREED
jgi:probable rRNA maturation factor